MPTQSLTADQATQATQYFAQHDIPLKQVQAKRTVTDEDFTLGSYQKLFQPNESGKVATIAIGALFEIYNITPTTPLTLQKGWR